MFTSNTIARTIDSDPRVVWPVAQDTDWEEEDEEECDDDEDSWDDDDDDDGWDDDEDEDCEEDD